MTTLSYKCLIVFYPTEYMQKSFFFPAESKYSTHSAFCILKIPVRAPEAFLGLLSKIPFFGSCLGLWGMRKVKGASIECKHVTGCYQAVHNLFFFSFSTSFSMVPLDFPTREDGEVESFQLFSTDITDEYSHTHGTCPKNKSLSAGRPSNLKTSISYPLLQSGCLPQTDSSLLSRQLLFLSFTNLPEYPP